jgi:quercetin dioxygenase-like cupin family protein
MLKAVSSIVFLLLLSTVPQMPPVDADPKPVPVYEEPRHHLVFQNQFVRLLDVHIPAQQATNYHIHANPLVGVTIHDAPSWQQLLGQERQAKESPDPDGEPFDNWDRQRPYTHRVGNFGQNEIHYFASEWLASPGIKSDPLPDTATRKLFKEGEHARIYRITLGPGESTETHTHAAPGSTIQAIEGDLEDKGSQPAASGGKGEGAWKWRDAGYRHTLRNLGKKAIQVVEIDWR